MKIDIDNIRDHVAQVTGKRPDIQTVSMILDYASVEYAEELERSRARESAAYDLGFRNGVESIQGKARELLGVES